MSQQHKNALHAALRAEGNLHHQPGTKPPSNPQKVIAASTKDVLLDPLYDDGTEQATNPNLDALSDALKAGSLSPSDAQAVVTHLSLGKPMPPDLLRRVAAALKG
jgi:hypothetical protein